jgi:hypothetical protein
MCEGIEFGKSMGFFRELREVYHSQSGMVGRKG